MKLIRHFTLLALSALVASAATHVHWTVALNDGTTPATGTISLSGPTGGPYLPTTQTITIGSDSGHTNGVVDFRLQGCPACSYKATYSLTDSTGKQTVTWDERWVVPDTPSTVTIPSLWAGQAPPYYLLNIQQVNHESCAVGQLWVWNGLAWECQYPASSTFGGLIWRGNYDGTRTYAANDVVGYSGSSYVALLPGSGNNPASSPTFWGPFAMQGSPGTPGAAGPTGPAPSGTGVVKVVSGVPQVVAGASTDCVKVDGTSGACGTGGGGGGPAAFSDLTGLPSDNSALNTALTAKATITSLNAHISDTSNPHSTTKVQVGLGNVVNSLQLTAGNNFSDLSNMITARANLGLGSAALLNVGTAAGTVAAGDHLHAGVYAPFTHVHAAADVTSGLFNCARLGTLCGAADGTLVLWSDGVWRVPPGASGGEANTASNTGTVGVGVFKAKAGTDLSFYKLNAASSKLSVALNGTDRVDLDIVPGNIDHTTLANVGTNSHAQIDSHIASTSNPHNTTAAQVGLGNVTNTSDANKPVSTAQQTALNLKADLAGPAFSGVPAAPTAAVDTNTTQLATAAFVLAQAASATPAMDGTGAVGTSTRFARGDHVHASDTSRVPTSTTVNGHALNANVTVTKTDLALGNVDNTADTAKPVSTAQATALALKQDLTGKDANSGYMGRDSSGNATIPGTLTAGSFASAYSGVAQTLELKQGTVPASPAANSFQLRTPTSIPTSYFWAVPGADAAGAIASDGAGHLAIKGLQGTDIKLLTAGTVSGTAATLCTDANGGATTTGCTSGGGTTVNVNGSSVATPNFNQATPAAEAGYRNVKWQVSTSSVSAEVPPITPADLPAEFILTATSASGTAYTGTLPSGVTISSYTPSEQYIVVVDVANTGAATVAFGTAGAKSVKRVIGGITTALPANDWCAGQIVTLRYDGTNFQMTSPPCNAIGLTDTAVRYVSKSGSDGNSGASWAQAKLTVAAGVNALPTTVSGVTSHYGTVFVGPGLFTEAATPIEFNSNIRLACTAYGDGGIGHGTIIKLGNGRNTALFAYTSAYAAGGGYAHGLQVENCMFDGNAANNTTGPDLVQIYNGGFGNTFRNTGFQNANGFGLTIERQAVNFSCYSCTWGSNVGGAFHLHDTAGGNVVSLYDTQIDDSGNVPIVIDQTDTDSGGSNIFSVFNLKTEANTGSTHHQHVIQFNPRTSGGNPFTIVIQGFTALNPSGAGAGLYAIYEANASGYAANWEITGANVGNYTGAFQSAKTGQVSGPQIKHLVSSDTVNLYQRSPDLELTGGAGINSGLGTPEGAVTANIGSVYLRTDGGTGTALYVKETGSGNTGWVAKAQQRTCELHIWGSGTSQVLQDSDDEPASCYNDFGKTETITAVRCWADQGTPTVLPKITGGSNLLSGNLTCGTAAWALADGGGGRPSLSVSSLSSGASIDGNIVVAGGAATNIRLVVTLAR